jgi:hypothetical protein
VADLTHLQSARAVAVGDENHRARAEAETLARRFAEMHVSEYVGRLRRGDAGAADRYLRGLRYEADVDPWLLVACIGARYAAGLGGSGPDQEPVEASAPAAAAEREDTPDGIG